MDQVIIMNSRMLFMKMVRNIHYPHDHGVDSSILSNLVLPLHVGYVYFILGPVVLVPHILIPSTAVISITNATIAHVWPVSFRCEALVRRYRLTIA
jgi:hypothetical protein